MKKATVVFILIVCMAPRPARADLFGGDVVVLTQILANALMQLVKLKEILQTGNDTLNLMKDIHRGINESIEVFRTIDLNSDSGIYGDWKKAEDALRKLKDIYGIVVKSPESRIQSDTDTAVAEAISFNNSLYEYAKNIDEVGNRIRKFGDTVSPAWSQKLTAQTMGVVLQVMNHSLRTQATTLKLQAQQLARENHEAKEMTKHILSTSETLSSSMKNISAPFNVPRF